MIDLTISIVSYNTKDLLLRCLRSIYRHTRGLKFEVIVVDNASTDGSARATATHFPSVKLIHNRTNRFYTQANNQALKLARGKYFLILNSDMFIQNNIFPKMISYLASHKTAAALEPLQFYETGRIAPTGSRHNTVLADFFELTWLGRQLAIKSYLRHFRYASRSRRRTWVSEVICDAAFMTSTQLLQKIGGYDERLKLYYTENDLCRRLQSLGLSTVHFSGAAIYHRVSASTNQVGWPVISQVYAQDLLTYYLTWAHPISAYLLYFSLKLNNFIIALAKAAR